MVSLKTADKALKSVYLGVISDQLNTSCNPLLTKIEQTSSDVWGKEIIKLVSYGLNGGVGAGDEVGNLPIAAANNYAQFKVELKNLYGSIEISDKAIRASQNNVGAFVNLLNAEMEGLLKASKYNLGRMLYGDGTGKITTVSVDSTAAVVTVVSTKSLAIGMVIDILNPTDSTKKVAQARIVDIDTDAKKITLDRNVAAVAKDIITMQNSQGFELTGLGAIFGEGDLYGLNRSENSWLNPYKKTTAGKFEIAMMQDAIDHLDEVSGSTVDFIACSYDVKKAYIASLTSGIEQNRRDNLDSTIHFFGL